MELGIFCTRNHWLTKDEYITLWWQCVKAVNGHSDDLRFLQPSLSAAKSLRSVRPLPFGDVLCRHENDAVWQKLCERSGLKSLEEVVSAWQQWHVNQIQPLSDYHLSANFGRRLYENEHEKRLCAEFIAESSKFGLQNIVHDSDHVIIPEGTSSFYVGLAICARRKNLWLITTNGALIREINENPRLAAAARNVTVVGGELDPDHQNGGFATRGFIGKETEKSFHLAIKDNPGATIVICSVNGFLPVSGPFAPKSPKTGSTRYSLLKDAFDSNVRKVVFVADHSKLQDSRRDEYGDPIFSKTNEWREIFEKNRDRIAIVVAAPEAVRLDASICEIPPSDRTCHGLVGPLASGPDQEYLRSAKELDQISRGHGFDSQFYEVGGHMQYRSGPRQLVKK